MSVELDGMKLVVHERDPNTGRTKKIRSVQSISISEERKIVEHVIPGSDGSVLQDLGRRPVKLVIEGLFYGEKAREDVEELRAKYKSGKPLPFISSLSGIADVKSVLVKDLKVEDASSVTEVYRYTMTLVEHVEPEKEEKGKAPSQEKEAKEDVDKKSDDALSSFNTIKGKVVDKEGKPKEATVKIVWDEGEYVIEVSSDGVFEKDFLKPGNYKIIVEPKDYEKEERDVVIPPKKGGDKYEVEVEVKIPKAGA